MNPPPAQSTRRGRPKLEAPKQQVSVRLDPDVLAKLREAGPGWQTKLNALLRRALCAESMLTRN